MALFHYLCYKSLSATTEFQVKKDYLFKQSHIHLKYLCLIKIHIPLLRNNNFFLLLKKNLCNIYRISLTISDLFYHRSQIMKVSNIDFNFVLKAFSSLASSPELSALSIQPFMLWQLSPGKRSKQ